MSNLPRHVAGDDELIPELAGRDLDGPDLRLVTPIADMLSALAEHRDNADAYVDQFRAFLSEAGIDVSLLIERDGTECLMVGGRSDRQMRHRSRWGHFLFEHLDQQVACREELCRQLWREGRCADNRHVTFTQTTTAVRDFLRIGGRILVTPDGRLTEGGGLPQAFINGSQEEQDECRRAGRAYFDLHLRSRAREQIKRAVRMLGRRTDNGWMVLEARS